MGFFDKIKNTLFEADKIQDKIEEVQEVNDKSLGDKAIEKALYGVKKYYEFKVKVVNQITDIQEEWHFYDEALQRKKVTAIENQIQALELEKNDLQESCEREQEEIKYLNITLQQNEDEIQKNKQQITSSSNPESVNAVIKKLEAKNADLRLKIIESMDKANEMLKEIESLDQQVKPSYFNMIKALAFIPEECGTCRLLAQKHNINNHFTQIGLMAIEYYNEGNLGLAVDYAIKYFEMEQDEDALVHTPIIEELFARYLILKKSFKEAKERVEKIIEYYPERIEYHQIMKEIHEHLGEIQEARVEEKIIALLS